MQPQQPYGFAPGVPNYDLSSPQAFEGTMDSGGMGIMGPSSSSMMLDDPTVVPTTFVPNNNNNPYASKQLAEDEPPLLEELGINIEHIIMKTKAVVVPFRRFHKSNHSVLTDPALIMEDADLAGPLALALLLGGELMMTGKLQFGYIYGFGVFGCLAMTVILNLMSPDKAISFWTVASVLGYALLPVNILAALKIVFWGYFTEVLGVITVIWSTTASTRLLEVGCGMVAQRYLLAYPIALLYSAFVLITIF
jgi:protein YIPF5/7